MKKIFLILILFCNSILFGMFGGIFGSGGDDYTSSVSGISSFSNTVASNPGLASVLSSTDNVLSNLGNSPVIQWINNSIGAPIGALIEGTNITTGSSINNNTTNQTPTAIPTSPPITCVSTGSSENPYYAAVGCSGKTTVQCLLASAEAALLAGGLPILGLRVTGPEIGGSGKWPAIVQTYINPSSPYVNNSCVSGAPYSLFNSMAGLCDNSTGSALQPYFSYITNCLEEGKIDIPSTGYGRAYNNKVFFNNANATFNGQTVNPIQCMACGTTGSISSCNVVVNDANNPYPACATPTPAPTTTNQSGWGNESSGWGNQSEWGQNQYGQFNNRPQF